MSDPKFTAIISDLHLCEAESIDPARPLWKKFKTREFFFDNDFKDFTELLQKRSGREPVELVLNGDIFDFDSCMALPEDAPYHVSGLEKKSGLYPQEPKSSFKIRQILHDHSIWVQALRNFVQNGNSVVFVIGNHDLELHFQRVQKDIIEALDLTEEESGKVRFCAWFYISNCDTLIEHGNQYDPYCLCHNPVNPLVQKFNRVEVRVPFGNLAGRYMINGMGFFNPHVDSNYIMTMKEYVVFFFRYLIRSQPLILWTWFYGAGVTLIQSIIDMLLPELKDPLTIEDRIDSIAQNANATPRMVREMKELTVHPAASNPILIMRELWLDRAFLVIIAFFLVFQLFSIINIIYSVSFFWMFIPMSLFIPFFIFYAKSIRSSVHKYKEPDERILSLTTRITRTRRVVYGHTHIYRHSFIGGVEHLNSGCWSPAFLDVECTQPYGKKTFVWIEPAPGGERQAQLLEFKAGQAISLGAVTESSDASSDAAQAI